MKILGCIAAVISVLIITGCKKDFLNRLPQTDVNEDSYFNTPGDLETYTNGFYPMMSPSYNDIYSDNLGAFTGSSVLNNITRGMISSANVGGWGSWGNIRRINFMMDNLHKTKGDQAKINHYVGIAKFFRAYLYYNLVKDYNDVAWYSSVIKAEDEAALTKPADPRTLVVDSVMQDLEFAAKHIEAEGTNTRVTKWAALTLLARIALHEGTYRKYHSELALASTADTYLERAVSATQEIMTKGGFSIHNTGKNAADFSALFSSNTLAENKEVIFYWKNDASQGIGNNTHTVLDWQWALSGDLMQEFLMKDGTAFTDIADYDKKSFQEVFIDRDPRLTETIVYPGFKTNPLNENGYVTRPSFGGYLQIKFYPRDPSLRGGWDLNYTDLPFMRYAEVLLINAEAQAELGQISQSTLDQTVNVLRDRVGMPHVNMMDANATPDPFLAKKYPNLVGNHKGIMQEIRRERRVELACEGFRTDDIMRWGVGERLAVDPYGMYVKELGAIDVTGDGKYDFAILEEEGKLGPIMSLPEEERKAITKYYLSEKSFYLTEGLHGYIKFVKDKEQKREFITPKYYYKPIPKEQLILNPNLKQPFGWN